MDGGAVLLSLSGSKPGMLNILQCSKQLLPTRNYLSNNAKVEKL